MTSTTRQVRRVAVLGANGAMGSGGGELFAADGLHEDVVLTNFTREPVELELTLEVDADFADKDETKLPRRRQKGKLRRDWRRLCQAETDHGA